MRSVLLFLLLFSLSARSQELADSLTFSRIIQLADNENIVKFKGDTFVAVFEVANAQSSEILSQRDGWYVQYDLDSSLRYSGHYNKWKREGLFIHFDENELVKRSEHYHKDLLEGPAKEYYSNGQVRTSTDYKKGKKHGELLGFYMDGTKLYFGKYKKDKMIGQRMYWDHRGNPANGEMKWYHENGVLKLTGKCVNGLPDGQFSHYNEKGELVLTVDYFNGLPHGSYKVYDGEGHLMLKVCYYMGKASQNNCR